MLNELLKLFDIFGVFSITCVQCGRSKSGQYYKRNNKTFILMEIFRGEWQKQMDNEAKELLGNCLKNNSEIDPTC